MDLLVNNFTSGEVSPKLGGRPDLELYHTGASLIENFLVMLQGGITRRPGTAYMATLAGQCRIIPFIISAELSFIVEVADKVIRIRKSDGTIYPGVEGFETPYLKAELSDIQFTQDWKTLYLAHRNHPPKTLSYIGGSFVWASMDPVTDTKYGSIFTGTGNYPGCVAYCANRLWYASSTNHPYRLWASRPFNIYDFRTFDIVTSTEEVIKDLPWPEGWEEDKDLIFETSTIERDVISADSAMVLEVGSSRNDRIEWLTVGQNLIVGTASGEWIMPGNIDALAPQIVQTSAYGSAPLQALNANEDILFIQSGRRRCRAYVAGDGSYSSPDITYSADHILAQGVKEWAFQRVPEPRAYLVLNDGTVAVLSYNKLYGIQGWSRWTFDGQVLSVAVIDDTSGQRVIFVIQRDDGVKLELVNELSDVHSDLHNTLKPRPFESVMISTRLDMELQDGTSIGKRKRVGKVVLRLLDSKGLKAGYNGLETYAKTIDEGDVELFMGGGYDRELRMEVRSIDDKPLTVLAMVYELEVGR